MPTDSYSLEFINPFEGKNPKDVWNEIKANFKTKDKKQFFKEAEEYLNKSKKEDILKK